VAERATRWRLGGFGPASEEPYRRRVTDGIKLGIESVVLAILVMHASYPSALEKDVFQAFNDLPGSWYGFFRGVYALGTVWALGLAIAAAVIGRRWRLARDLLVAGLGAWAIAHALGAWVAGDGISESFKAVTRVSGVSPEFPAARLALLVGVIATAGPYVTRPTRRIGQVLVLTTAVSSMYLGTALPDDVLGGIFLGLAVAAAVHLIFGSPGGRPTAAQVTAALAELGIDARGVRLARKQPQGSTLMVGEDDEGPLSVRVIGRDEADAQFYAKAYRFMAYKDSGPTLYLTRLQQVEHEAYVTLLARDAGVTTTEVVVAGQAGPKAAIFVERPVAGMPLSEAHRDDVTDAVLVDAWRQLGLLHNRARVSHGALDGQHVLVELHAAALVDFANAAARSDARLSRDVAGMLVSTSLVAGEERAVAAAVDGIGPDALGRALPYMQPAALSRSVRSAAGRRRLKARLDKLRTLSAQAAGVDPPQLQELHRVSSTNVLMAVGTLIGIGALLSQVGSPEQLYNTIKNAQWDWAIAALAISLATNVPYAISLMGTVRMKLPLVQTTELQVSMSFANLAIPAVGGMASQVRFLQKQGVDLASAVASGGLLSTVANVVVSIALMFVAIAVSPDAFKTGDIPAEGVLRLLLVAVLIVGVVVLVVKGIPRIRNAVMPSVSRAWVTISEALRSPRQVFFLVVGAVLTAVLYGFCLLACLKAFDATLSFWTLLALSIFFGQVAALIPIPGGGTAVSSVGISGALTGFGIHAEAAVAAVLLNQVVVSYLPAIPGWVATNHLLHHDYL
jgi:undecaprenyl-diphosphatase